MEEGRDKVRELTGLRVGLAFVFFVISGLGIITSAAGPFLFGIVLAVLCLAALLVSSLSVGDDRMFLWAWVAMVVLWLGFYPFLDPSANLLEVIAFVSASMVLLDIVHMMGLVCPMARWKSTMTADESKQIWTLLSRHLVRSTFLGVATFLSSVLILVLVFPLSLYTSPLLGPSVFAAAALVLASLVIADKRTTAGLA